MTASRDRRTVLSRRLMASPVISLLEGLSAQVAQAAPPPLLRECEADEQIFPARTSYVTLPQAGEVSEVEVGGPMVSSIREEVLDAGIVLTSPVKAEGSRLGAKLEVDIPPGRAVAVTARGGTVFVPEVSSFRYLREKKERSGGSKPVVGVVINPSGGLTVRVLYGMSTSDYPTTGGTYEPSRCRRLGLRGFRREIVYSGAAKGVVSLQYREYEGGYARAPFSQSLTYDLADGDEIGFKGARVKILQVSNTGLRYIVLKPFDERQ